MQPNGKIMGEYYMIGWDTSSEEIEEETTADIEED